MSDADDLARVVVELSRRYGTLVSPEQLEAAVLRALRSALHRAIPEGRLTIYQLEAEGGDVTVAYFSDDAEDFSATYILRGTTVIHSLEQ